MAEPGVPSSRSQPAGGNVGASRPMIITTTENIPEARLVKTLGQVFGLTVRSRSLGGNIAAVLKTLSKFTPAHYEISIDDQKLSLDAMLAIVGSGMSYGGGMKVLPSASLIDGVLDVCIVEAMSKMAFLRAFPRVFNGSHTTHPSIQMHRARRVTMEANRRMQVHADGEQIGPLPAIFEVLPAALPVVIGPGAKGIR